MDESARFKIMRFLVIGMVLVGAGAFFARLFLENQQKSKASEAFANVTMSSSLDAAESKANVVSQMVKPGQTIDISIAINQKDGLGVSGIDLSLSNPGLSFVDPSVGKYSIDVNSAFSETVIVDQQKDSTGRVTLSRLVMVAKKK